MKRALKKKSSLYAYLDSTKVLETGSDQDIALARKAYWRAYKTAWRKSKRKELKQFVIALTPAETKLIIDAANAHHCSPTKFIKISCFAYLRCRYIAPDQVALGTIKQLLTMNYAMLQKFHIECLVSYQAGVTLIELIRSLEEKVVRELTQPKTIEQCILEAIREDPKRKEAIFFLLQNCNV